ncbi:hypothetical protein D3C81_1823370 [compost metagenome]
MLVAHLFLAVQRITECGFAAEGIVVVQHLQVLAAAQVLHRQAGQLAQCCVRVMVLEGAAAQPAAVALGILPGLQR